MYPLWVTVWQNPMAQGFHSWNRILRGVYQMTGAGMSSTSLFITSPHPVTRECVYKATYESWKQFTNIVLWGNEVRCVHIM